MSPVLQRLLAQDHHPAFGWRLGSSGRRSYTRCDWEEMGFYVVCHAYLRQVGHPLHPISLREAEEACGFTADSVELTPESRRDAIRWHFLVRPHVAGEGWNRDKS